MARTPKQNRYRLLPGGLAAIELTRGFSTLVGANQLHRLLAYKWAAKHTGGKYGKVYAVANIRSGHRGPCRQVYLHRLVLPHDQAHTDHRNGDTLDNRLANLRPATASHNVAAQRKLRERKTSQHRGVSYDRRFREPWVASIVKDRVQHRQRFATEEEAAHWYDLKALEFFGEFAALSFCMPATIQ